MTRPTTRWTTLWLCLALPATATAEVFWVDSDGDGAGDPDAPVEAATQPPLTVTNDDDCDDTDATVHVGARELLDGKDNDCDG